MEKRNIFERKVSHSELKGWSKNNVKRYLIIKNSPGDQQAF
jgi:hypothetical protein